MRNRMMEQQPHALLGPHRELAYFRTAKLVEAKGRAATVEVVVRIDHEGEKATLPVGALEVAVAMPVEKLPYVVAVKSKSLVETDWPPRLSNLYGMILIRSS